MMNQVGKCILWILVLVIIALLAGPHEVGAQDDQLIGGGTSCQWKWTDNCFPGCEGAEGRLAPRSRLDRVRCLVEAELGRGAEEALHRLVELDAARGLRSGLIDATQYRKLTSALERGKRPAWDTPLGGKLGIHGGGNSRDWTLGSVALTDEASEELFEIIPYGTPVTIRP